MNARRSNPFDVTKAVDFTDEEINKYFVDMPTPGFVAIANPKSPMPMLIKGGKGSGKTHLMRYFSYPLQKLRHSNAAQGIQDEGYIGIYLRCGGLNAARFDGKGQTQEAWDAVFAYYMELWLGQLVIQYLGDYLEIIAARPEHVALVAKKALLLLDEGDHKSGTSLAEVRAYFHHLQRSLDSAINNAALTRLLDVRVMATSGRIVFGLPRLLSDSFEELRNVQFLYLLDEFENFTERQQRYFNTLLREKELPCSFKIGGRTYGFKTLKTFSAEEEIKEGSEYEILALDERMRSGASGDYERFARRLCISRLTQAQYIPVPANEESLSFAFLQNAFEKSDRDLYCSADVAFVKTKYFGQQRPYLRKLAGKLVEGIKNGLAPGLLQEGDEQVVIALLSRTDYPLLEKLNIYLFYKDWKQSRNLLSLAESIKSSCDALVLNDVRDAYYRQLEKRKNDLLAQLYRECHQKLAYTGIDTFIRMSEGLPRNLLVILKSVFNWSAFSGEGPFVSGPISVASQKEGVHEAAEWFFDDARMPGDDGALIRAAIRRLATMFREMRFSDKPSEKSLCTFSTDLARCTKEARRVVLLAEKWSLLIRVTEGQRDKNTFRIDEKFYINPMLAPRWDLPVSRGGALALPPTDVDLIFDEARCPDFEAMRAKRVAEMNAPLFGLAISSNEGDFEAQSTLQLGE